MQKINQPIPNGGSVHESSAKLTRNHQRRPTERKKESKKNKQYWCKKVLPIRFIINTKLLNNLIIKIVAECRNYGHEKRAKKNKTTHVMQTHNEGAEQKWQTQLSKKMHANLFKLVKVRHTKRMDDRASERASESEKKNEKRALS